MAVDGTGDGGLDRAVLQELRLVLGDEAFADMSAQYRRDGERLLAELGEAVAAGEPTAARQAAHSLRSISELIGAATLGRSCAGVEALARSGDTTSAGSHLPPLRMLFEQAATELQAFRDGR